MSKKSILFGAFLMASALVNHALAQSTTSYKYDSLGRLILQTSTNSTYDGFSYDSAGNRIVTTREAVPPPTLPDQLLEGQGLVANVELHSPEGKYFLKMQSDGNLVVYDANFNPVWSTATYNAVIAKAVMQSDGNFVLYGPNGQSYWTSGTQGHPGARLVMQDDSNLVIYDANNNPLWDSTGW